MRSPADNCRLFRQASQVAGVGTSGLLWIGCNDFEIAILAEREERVAGAGSGMNPTKGGADAGALFNEGDSGIEVARAQQDVVEQFWCSTSRP